MSSERSMNGERSMEDERHHAALNSILQALGDEFFELGRFTEEFQTSLSPALLRVANDPECHRNVQTLDLVAQRLAALSKYVLTIGRLLPDDWRINSQTALHNITLSDLQYRLKGAPLPEPGALESGDLDLF